MHAGVLFRSPFGDRCESGGVESILDRLLFIRFALCLTGRRPCFSDDLGVSRPGCDHRVKGISVGDDDAAFCEGDRSLFRDVMVVVAGQKRQLRLALVGQSSHLLHHSLSFDFQRSLVVFDQVAVDDQMIARVEDRSQHGHARARAAQEVDIRNDHCSTHH